jgi:beta-galactosidase
VDKTRIPVSFFAWKNRPKYFESPYRLNWNVPYEKGDKNANSIRPKNKNETP